MSGGVVLGFSPTLHVDTFTRERILEVEPWPELRLPGDSPRGALNAVSVFVDAPRMKFGDRTALIAEDGRWTYGVFARRVEKAAGWLAGEWGLRSGQRVLLRGRGSPWFAVWLHAVLKAGGVVVPVSPRLRSGEVAKMVGACAASLVMCDPDDADVVSDVPVLTYPKDIDRRADAFATVPTAADDVALIAFSSGTTGTPKATMHFHRDLVNLTCPRRRELMGVGPGVVVASNRAVTFPYALVGLCMMPFRYGATALMRHYSEVTEFFHAVAEFDARVVLSDPTSYRAALASETAPDGERAYLSCAEALAPGVARHWREETGMVLRNWLGVTEHLWLVTGAAPHGDRPGSVGVPLPGYGAAVFDAAGDPCPAGVAGRLGVGGPTGARLIDAAHQRAAVHRGYTLTGDWAHADADGYLWLHGRTDDMVNVEGILVAPADIEHVLLAHPQVARAAAIGVADADRGDQMHAFLTLAPGADPDTVVAEVRAALDAHLADYRRPGRLTVLAEMPYGPTGKIDRRSLRERLVSGQDGSGR